MDWTIFFIISVACLLLSVILAVIRGKSKYKSGRILDPFNILFAGVILSAVALFIPICLNTFKESECGIFETFLMAVYNMLRLFIVDGEFEFITNNISALPAWLFRGYSILSSVLFVLAPMLTFGFVLSFFKNVSAYKRYITHYNAAVYIFSELNERSLALAESLHDAHEKDRFFVFTDVFDREEERELALLEKAKELGAVCFKKDIVTVNFSFHNRNSPLRFFAIGEDRSENVRQALKLIGKFKYRDNTDLYVFSTQVEAELLLTNAFNEAKKKENGPLPVKIKVRRVNEVQSLISRNLYEVGYRKIFSSACPEADGIRKITAVVVGMGQHGTEMTKALAWFCQMDGYRAEIHAFDIDEKADEKFASLCPELMDPKHNGVFNIDGEAKYKITIHPKMDVDTKSFDDRILALPGATYVFVALGNDEKNISTAVKLRSLFLRRGYTPEIQAVVYNADKKEALTDIVNFRKQAYAIDFIGDVKTSYSEAVILDSDVEAEARNRHLKWGSESEFWQFDYNYRSSVASAIHRRMKKLCGIPGIEKEPGDRSEEELWQIRKLEHCRWNAYMRSEGYVYSGSVEKSSRNDLAKMHNYLVPFDELPEEAQIKDDD